MGREKERRGGELNRTAGVCVCEEGEARHENFA